VVGSKSECGKAEQVSVPWGKDVDAATIGYMHELSI